MTYKHFLEHATLLKAKLNEWMRSPGAPKKLLKMGAAFIVLLASTFFALFLLVWAGAFGTLPSSHELSLIRNPQPTEVYGADSVLLGRYFIQERSVIAFSELPSHVENAVLATEDIRFYEHGGVDMKSMGRVLFKSLMLQKESSGGGSTITQQLAKNLYPRRQYHAFSLLVNKMREMLIAWRIEEVMDKKSILMLYLNTIPFADNTFGIEAAAQRFFSVRTRSLSKDQGAVLVGMLKATHYYNPRLFPERAKVRRDVVLAQMFKYNMLQKDELRSLQQLPIKLRYNKITHHSGLAPYFREYIRRELLEWCRTHVKPNGEPYNLYTDGLKVYTTIDSRLQQYAEEALSTQMASLQKQFISHWNKRDPWHGQPQVVKDAVRRSDRYKSLKRRDLSEAEILKIMKTPVPMTVFTWNGEKEMKMSPLDSIKYYLKFLNAGFMAMDPRNGAVRAWVGGINHHYFQYDHVKQTTRRQVGSTFKPIVYAAALERGVRPCDFISAERQTYTNVNNTEWSPANTEDNYDLQYSLEGALAFSVNTVSVKVLEMAGTQHTINLARRMGIKSDMPAVPSLALGVADLSMMEMVTAYACFVNRGRAVQPFYLTSICSVDGDVLSEFQSSPSRSYALSPETADKMIHMLKRTVNEGTGGRLRYEYGIINDIGGKTGTTQSNADGWFIGVTPRLVTGAWVGADDPRIRFRSTALGQGANTALPIVARFLQKVNKDSEFRTVADARFPELSDELQDELNCELFKSEGESFWENLFSPGPKKQGHDDPAKKKDNILKKLFGKKSN